MKKFIFVLAALLMSCASQKTEPEKSASTFAKKTRATASVRANSQKRENQEFAHEQAMILAAKQKTSKSIGSVSAHPQEKRLVLSLPEKAGAKVPEAKLMAELQDRYDMNDEVGFQSRYLALQRYYPKSPHMMDVHYMAGLLAVSNRNYGAALLDFDRILKASPRGQAASKAMFAKAITYKRMNLPEPSRRLLRTVQTQYPKSLEAQRAALELKIQEQRTQ